MQISKDEFACDRCARHFTPKVRGRRPLYCGQTCRQRSYEARRRAALQCDLPAAELAMTAAAPPVTRRLGPRPRCEAGRHRTVVHALRPDGVADPAGRRSTLCGTITRPDPLGRYFGDPVLKRPFCATCSWIDERFPLQRFIDPPADLSRVKHLLAGARLGVLRGDERARAELVARLYQFTV